MSAGSTNRNQMCARQHLQVLGDLRLVQTRRMHQLGNGGLLLLVKQLEQETPIWLTNRIENTPCIDHETSYIFP